MTDRLLEAWVADIDRQPREGPGPLPPRRREAFPRIEKPTSRRHPIPPVAGRRGLEVPRVEKTHSACAGRNPWRFKRLVGGPGNLE